MPAAEPHSPSLSGTCKNLRVREAGFDDAALIAELTRTAWSGKVAAKSSGHRETSERVLQHLQHGGAFILVKEDQAIGSVRWVPLESESQVWAILRMGVLPAWRGERLSEHLVEAVIHRALSAEVSELRLGVRADQPRLLDLYAALGFELAPELEYAHANPQEPPPTVMRRLLRY